MKINTLFLIAFSFCVFCGFAAHAQQLKFNATNKVNHSNYQYYLGNDKGANYVLASNYDVKGEYLHQDMSGHAIVFSEKPRIMLLKYNERFGEPQEVELSFSHDVNSVADIWFDNGSIIMIYTSTKGITNKLDAVYREVFDENGVSKSADKIIEIEDKSLYAASPSLYCSKNHEWFLYNQGSNVRLLDKAFKKVWQTEISTVDYDYKVLNDGSVFIRNMAKSSEAKSIIAINVKGRKKEIPVKPNAEYKIDEDAARLTVVSQNGKPATMLKEFRSKDFECSVYDLKDLSLIKEYKIPFDNDILMKVNNSRNPEKVKGLPDLVLQNVLFPSIDKSPILVFEQYKISEVDNQSSTGRTLSATYYAIFGDIITVKLKEDGSSTQKMLERKAQVESSYTPVAEMFSLYKSGNIYILFNNASGSHSFKLQSYALTTGLEPAGHREYDTDKDHDIYLKCCTAQKISDNKYLIMGSWKKNNGTAFLAFDEQ